MLTFSQNISNKEQLNWPLVLQIKDIDRFHINYLSYGEGKGYGSLYNQSINVTTSAPGVQIQMSR